MPDFHVYGHVTGSKYLGKFTANSKEEAMEMAEKSENNYVSLCHQCSDECEDPEIHSMNAEVAT
jgi:hypothetical protein